MIFHPPTNFALFKQRRHQLRDLVRQTYHATDGIIILCAGFETARHVFRPDSSFYYMTGVREAGAVLCMHLHGPDVLYVPQFNEARLQWVKTDISGSADAKKYEFEQIKYLGSAVPGYVFKPTASPEIYADFIADIKSELKNAALYTLLSGQSEYPCMYDWFADRIKSWLGQNVQKLVDIAGEINSMRRVKDEYEVDLIYKAVQITTMAHKATAPSILPGRYEYEIQATLEGLFTHAAGAMPAFPSIVATGKNTTVLHYTERNAVLKDGDLVVVDIGAEYGMYASDLTRTYPVGGSFSDRQREVYSLVLETQAYIESLASPGMFLKNVQYPEKSLQQLALTFLERRGYGKYVCHGLGHYLGLDVHDVGDYDTPLQPGDVFTLEPGLYIPQENIGIRIEDLYVMADDGVVCLSYQLPKQPEELVQMMKSHE